MSENEKGAFLTGAWIGALAMSLVMIIAAASVKFHGDENPQSQPQPCRCVCTVQP